MATDSPFTNLTKKRSHKEHTIDNNFIPSNHISLKRRKIHQYKQYNTNYNQKENHPLTHPYTNNQSNQSKQSLKPSNLSYLNTCSPFQPSPLNTAFQKLNEFWRPKKETNQSKTPEFLNIDYEIFDFNSLLKSLTKDFEEEKEREEFNNLAIEIEQLNINLSSQQIQKIIDDENEINAMITKIKDLNIKMNENKNDRKIIELLNKLSQLTIDNNNEFDCESDEFDTESNEFDIEQIENNGNNNDNIMVNNNGINNYENIGNNCKKLDKKHSKLKQKSIVHKCAKFMLSMLMIGAPVFYYYVS